MSVPDIENEFNGQVPSNLRQTFIPSNKVFLLSITVQSEKLVELVTDICSAKVR